MKNRRGRRLTVLLLWFALLGRGADASSAGIDEGFSAFLRGQYEQAAALLESALASGDWRNSAERSSALRALATAYTFAGQYARAEAAVSRLLDAKLIISQPDATTASDLLLAGRIAKEQ